MSKANAPEQPKMTRRKTVKTKVTKHPEKGRKESIEVIIEKDGGTNETKTILVDTSDDGEENKESIDEDDQDDSDKLNNEDGKAPDDPGLVPQDASQLADYEIVKENECSDESERNDSAKENAIFETGNIDLNGQGEPSLEGNDIMIVIEQSEPNHKEDPNAKNIFTEVSEANLQDLNEYFDKTEQVDECKGKEFI